MFLHLLPVEGKEDVGGGWSPSSAIPQHEQQGDDGVPGVPTAGLDQDQHRWVHCHARAERVSVLLQLLSQLLLRIQLKGVAFLLGKRRLLIAYIQQGMLLLLSVKSILRGSSSVPKTRGRTLSKQEALQRSWFLRPMSSKTLKHHAAHGRNEASENPDLHVNTYATSRKNRIWFLNFLTTPSPPPPVHGDSHTHFLKEFWSSQSVIQWEN